MQPEAEYWLSLAGDEELHEKAAKIIEWFLDTNWHETWATDDSKVVAEYVENVVAELRALK